MAADSTDQQSKPTRLPPIEHLYDRLARPILALAFQLTGEQDVAEDVLQETFLAAHRARRTFRGESSAETWLFRIAINASREVGRRRRREGRRRDLPAVTASPEASSTSADRDERARVLAAMERLSEGDRAVLALLTLRDLPAREVAAVLDISEGTVYSRAHAARRRLRELLSSGSENEEYTSKNRTSGAALSTTGPQHFHSASTRGAEAGS